MAKKILTQVEIVDALIDEDKILIESGGKMGRTKVRTLKNHLQGSDMWLQQVAFYIDINEPAAVADRVNTGGNTGMRLMWEAQWRAGVMDVNGRWAELSPENNRYFADGTPAVDANGDAAAAISGCDFMNLIPETWCYVQSIDIGGKTIDRMWLSLMPLPGGWKEPKQVVAAFKGTVIGGHLRSLPNKEVTRSKSMRSFWLDAQARSKNHGLAGVYFRNFLLFYMMCRYGQRSSQTAKLEDGTLIWGPGLDGTKSASGIDQYTIKTGATLHLGARDGNADVLDAQGVVCQSVRVKNFENPWGQFWEFDAHQISFESEVWAWRSNFMPAASSPVKADFSNIDCDKYTRHTANIYPGRMNINKSGKQGVFMIPQAAIAGITYGDYYYYALDGQLWLWGGYSFNGSGCGLAYSHSNYAWSISISIIGARLAYFGDITEVNGADLAA